MDRKLLKRIALSDRLRNTYLIPATPETDTMVAELSTALNAPGPSTYALLRSLEMTHMIYSVCAEDEMNIFLMQKLDGGSIAVESGPILNGKAVFSAYNPDQDDMGNIHTIIQGLNLLHELKDYRDAEGQFAQLKTENFMTFISPSIPINPKKKYDITLSTEPTPSAEENKYNAALEAQKAQRPQQELQAPAKPQLRIIHNDPHANTNSRCD